MKDFRLAIAQIESKFGDLAYNIEKHARVAKESCNSGANMVLFPELGLSGYSLRDLSYNLAVRPDGNEMRPIIEASKEIAIFCSFPEMCPDHVVRISGCLYIGGEIAQIYRKIHLPTHGLFEEARYFGKGNTIRAFDTPFGRLGIMICRDLWHPEEAYVLSRDGAEMIIACSAIPARVLGKNGFSVKKFFERTTGNIAFTNQVFLASTNKVGYEDGVAFFGNSVVFGPDGHELAILPELVEHVQIVYIDSSVLAKARYNMSLYRESDFGTVLDEMERIEKSA